MPFSCMTRKIPNLSTLPCFSVDRFSVGVDNLDVSTKVGASQKEYMNIGPETHFALVVLSLTFFNPLTCKLKCGHRIRVTGLIFQNPRSLVYFSFNFDGPGV